MRKLVLGLALAILQPASVAVVAETARDYFKELYNVGALDRMADGYVCFDDSPELQTFFIFGTSDALKQFLVDKGEFAKMPKRQQAELNKGFLVVRQYDKGVALGDEATYSKDGNTWVTDTFAIGPEKAPMRMRLSITWETLRYKRAVEILDGHSTLKSQVARYGRCERVPNGIQQKGN